MLNCAIVDDAPHASALIESYVGKTPFLSLVGTFRNPVEALSFLQQERVDLIFLDIHMPELTGIEFLKILGGKAKVIVTSAHTEYAIEGFEHEVIDYLLKPIPFDRFFIAAQKALTSMSASTSDNLVDGSSSFILVKTETRGKMVKVDKDEIYYVEGLKNYVSIHTQNGRVVALLNIKDIAKELHSNCFLRVHKSYIVNVDKISVIEGNQIILRELQTGKHIIPIGGTYREAFHKRFEKHMMIRK